MQLIDDPVVVLGTATYTEAASKGMVIGAVRRDADTPLADTTNEFSPLITDANGYLKVEIFDGGGSHTVDGTVAATQSGSWTLAANSGVDIGDVTINNAAGASAVNIQDGGNSITVDNGGTFAVQATIAAGATSIAKAEDVGSADADVGVPAMAVRKATPVNTSGTDGDYEFLQMSAGRLWASATIDAALPAGTNAIGKLAANSGVDIGDVDVTSISAGANLIGDVGISGARTSGGTTIFRSIDIDESEEEIKASAGQIYWIHAMNLTASVLYLKFYNATAANVTVGTTTPVMTFPIATQATTSGAGFVLAIPNGIVFGTAISVACTTGVADADTGAPAANACVINIGYA